MQAIRGWRPHDRRISVKKQLFSVAAVRSQNLLVGKSTTKNSKQRHNQLGRADYPDFPIILTFSGVLCSALPILNRARTFRQRGGHKNRRDAFP